MTKYNQYLDLCNDPMELKFYLIGKTDGMRDAKDGLVINRWYNYRLEDGYTVGYFEGQDIVINHDSFLSKIIYNLDSTVSGI